MNEKKLKNVLRCCTFSTLLKLVHGNKIQLKYLPRLLQMFSDSIMTAPANALEAKKYNGLIHRHKIETGPVFIIGHWRSGTTFLHNLLTRDSQFGFPKLFHTIFPKSFNVILDSKVATKLVFDPIANFMPGKRLFDEMELHLDFPQEEEFAIARLIPASFYHSYTYPRQMGLFFKKYVLLNDISEQELADLKENYIFFLKKISYACDGKQLVLKNPVNTARIPFLLTLFPGAKFIHVYRNPFDIFESMKNMRAVIGDVSQLHSIPETLLEENIIGQYKCLMEAYFEQKELVPAVRLAEVKYEDLISRPEEEVERIYNHLNLEFTENTREALRRYLLAAANYRRNRFELSAGNRERIRREWGFAIETLGYSL